MAVKHELWHADSAQKKGSDLPKVGTRYFHQKSGVIYRVNGIIFDSERERWMILYSADTPNRGDDDDDSVEYCHLPEDFQREGRFLKVNG